MPYLKICKSASDASIVPSQKYAVLVQCHNPLYFTFIEYDTYIKRERFMYKHQLSGSTLSIRQNAVRASIYVELLPATGARAIKIGCA